FQSEDGIRDRSVTGVQTCALPTSCGSVLRSILGIANPWVEYRVEKVNQQVGDDVDDYEDSGKGHDGGRLAAQNCLVERATDAVDTEDALSNNSASHQ